MQEQSLSESLRHLAYQCLIEPDPGRKVQLSLQTFTKLQAGELIINDEITVNEDCPAGIPARPKLVQSYQLPKRSVASQEGHAALIHSFAHIEFNAINIAWDAVYRFSAMPRQFYFDWAKIAKEEASHFELLNDYLQQMGYAYGDFEAHDNLWNMVVNTAHDVLVRMALVPRVLEARGLDVTPDIIKKFKHHKYHAAADKLQIIYDDEIGHVQIGSHWYHYLCEQRQLDPEATFKQLIQEYATDKIRKPFNEIARQQAGFTANEMEILNSWSN